VQACKSYADALGDGVDDAAAASQPGDADDSEQKSAFDRAKELGTIEAVITIEIACNLGISVPN
jgi:hypothetical protein